MSLKVSAHAIRRYIERTPGLDEVLALALAELGDDATDVQVIKLFQRDWAGRAAIKRIRRMLKGGMARRMYRALGDGRYPSSGGYVQIRDGVVVTFRKRLRP